MIIGRILHSVILMMAATSLYPQSRTIISGTLLGADGKPMPLAHVHLDSPLQRGNNLMELSDTHYGRFEVDRGGEFSIPTDSTGPYCLAFSGVGHKRLEIPIVLTGQAHLRLDVRLAAMEYFREEYFRDLETPSVVADFEEVARGKQTVMNRLPDGTFSLEMPTSKAEIVYRIMNIGGDFFGVATTAASADSFAYTGWGLYSAVVHPVKGVVKIAFNPAALLRSRAPADVRFQEANAVEARLYSFLNEMDTVKHKRDEVFREYLGAGGLASRFAFDSRPQIAKVLARLGTESHRLLREELILESLEYAGLSTFPCDTTALRTAAREIPATSAAWAFHGSLPLQAVKLLEGKADYIEEIISRHPSRAYAAYLLFRQCTYAKQERRKVDEARLYARLITQFSESAAAKEAMNVLRPEKKMLVGYMLPVFSFRDLEDTTIIYTPQSFRGKYVLLDFWATWCAPCVEEIRFIDSAYQRYRGAGLEVLSISLDESRTHVQAFRRGRSPMPWKNAYVAKALQPETIAAYDVTFPKPILLDPSGRIAATEDRLRGKMLGTTLEKLLRK